MTEDTPTKRPALSRPLLITLISVGGALLIAIIVLLVVLLTSGGGGGVQAGPTPSSSDVSQSPSPTPSVSDEDSPTPEPSPSETEEEEAPPPPPPSTDAKINSFTINNSSNPVVQCNAASPVEFPAHLLVKWSSSNVDQVYFGIATNDASTSPFFENLPPSGNSNDDFPDGYDNGSFEFPCPGTDSQKYTLTVIGDGQKVSKSVTVTNNGD